MSISGIKAEAEKLNRYMHRYTSRAVNIDDALGVTGAEIMNRLFKMIDEIKPESKTMSIEITKTEAWKCPECDAPLNAEEVAELQERCARRETQVEFRCDDCGEELTADNTDCPSGEVSINPRWVYD